MARAISLMSDNVSALFGIHSETNRDRGKFETRTFVLYIYTMEWKYIAKSCDFLFYEIFFKHISIPSMKKKKKNVSWEVNDKLRYQ